MNRFEQARLRELEAISVIGSSKASMSPNPSIAAGTHFSKTGNSSSYSMGGSKTSINELQSIVSKLGSIEEAIREQTKSISYSQNAAISFIEKKAKIKRPEMNSVAIRKYIKDVAAFSAQATKKYAKELAIASAVNTKNAIAGSIKEKAAPFKETIIGALKHAEIITSQKAKAGEQSIKKLKKLGNSKDFRILNSLSVAVRTSMSEVVAFRRNTNQILAGAKSIDEQKVRLLAALVDINRYQGQELVSIRNTVQKDSGGSGNDFEIKPSSGPGILFKGLKALLNPIETFYNKPKLFIEKLKINNVNELSPVELLKKAGLHVSDQNKAFTFLGNAYPDIAQESNAIMNRQLHVQEQTFGVMSDIKVLLGGKSSTLNPDNVQSQKYDALTGEFINDKEFSRRRVERETAIETAQAENKTLLQKMLTTKSGKASEIKKASASLDNSRSESYSTIRKTVKEATQRKKDSSILRNTGKIIASPFTLASKFNTFRNSESNKASDNSSYTNQIMGSTANDEMVSESSASRSNASNVIPIIIKREKQEIKKQANGPSIVINLAEDQTTASQSSVGSVSASVTNLSGFRKNKISNLADDKNSSLFKKMVFRKKAKTEADTLKTDKDSNSVLHDILKALKSSGGLGGKKDKTDWLSKIGDIASNVIGSIGPVTAGLGAVAAAFFGIKKLNDSIFGGPDKNGDGGTGSKTIVAESLAAGLLGNKLLNKESSKASKAIFKAAQSAKKSKVVASVANIVKSSKVGITAEKAVVAAKSSKILTGASNSIKMIKSSSAIANGTSFGSRLLRGTGSVVKGVGGFGLRMLGKIATPLSALVGGYEGYMHPGEFVNDKGEIEKESGMHAATRGIFGSDKAETALGAAASTGLKYAAYGGTLGSFIPVLGTGVGAALGGLIGAGVGYFGHRSDEEEKAKVDAIRKKAMATQTIVADKFKSGIIPRGVRNNNPGNIKKSNISWMDKVYGGSGTFEHFKTPNAGIRALGKNLKTYKNKHQLTTVRSIITKWAPSSENKTEAYIKAVAKDIGVDPDAEIDFSKKGNALVKAIIKHENGINPYTDDMIAQSLAGLFQKYTKTQKPLFSAASITPLSTNIKANDEWQLSLDATTNNYPISLARPKEGMPFSGLWNEAKGYATGAYGKYSPMIAPAYDKAKGYATVLYGTVGNNLSEIKDSSKFKMESIGKQVSATTDDVLDQLKKINETNIELSARLASISLRNKQPTIIPPVQNTAKNKTIMPKSVEEHIDHLYDNSSISISRTAAQYAGIQR